jgi:histidine triad (HIT) family protein
MSEKTIFKKIIDKEIPATVVYEDDNFLAFLDIAPVSKGHTLLIPKQEYVWMQDLPDELVGQLFIKAKELMLAIKQGLLCDYVQIGVVGKDVPHAHIHLIPRYFNDILPDERPLQTYEGKEEMENYKQKIQSSLK